MIDIERSSHIVIKAELLWNIYVGKAISWDWTELESPEVTLTRPETGHGSTGHAVGDYGCDAPCGGLCHHGSVLRIRTASHTAVYVIGEYLRETDMWHAHWPD